MTQRRCKYCKQEFELRKNKHKRTYCYQQCCIDAHRINENEIRRIYQSKKPKLVKPKIECAICGRFFTPKKLGRKRNHCFRQSCITETLRRGQDAQNKRRARDHTKPKPKPYLASKKVEVKGTKRRCVKCGHVIQNGNWLFCSSCHSRVSEYQIDPIDAYGGRVG